MSQMIAHSARQNEGDHAANPFRPPNSIVYHVSLPKYDRHGPPHFSQCKRAVLLLLDLPNAVDEIALQDAVQRLSVGFDRNETNGGLRHFVSATTPYVVSMWTTASVIDWPLIQSSSRVSWTFIPSKPA